MIFLGTFRRIPLMDAFLGRIMMTIGFQQFSLTTEFLSKGISKSENAAKTVEAKTHDKGILCPCRDLSQFQYS
jgi:hypothetical protein